jgi:hypothetical protein
VIAVFNREDESRAAHFDPKSAGGLINIPMSWHLLEKNVMLIEAYRVSSFGYGCARRCWEAN